MKWLCDFEQDVVAMVNCCTGHLVTTLAGVIREKVPLSLCFPFDWAKAALQATTLQVKQPAPPSVVMASECHPPASMSAI